MHTLSSVAAGTSISVSDRVEPRIVASTGMPIIVVGLSLFIFLNAETPLWLIAMNPIVLGLGFAGVFASLARGKVR